MPMMAADDNVGVSTRMTKSEPVCRKSERWIGTIVSKTCRHVRTWTHDDDDDQNHALL